MSELSVGDTLPSFEMPTSGGGTVSNEDYAGKRLVLYFYPKDDTPGCTKEAIGFTESGAATMIWIGRLNTRRRVVLGVSKDPVKKHDKFVAKYELGITLASDENGDFCERMGVWVEKKMYGKTYFGIERATFLIGPDGTIQHIWRKVKVPGHVDEVLRQVNET